jgi:hypothetical protein
MVLSESLIPRDMLRNHTGAVNKGGALIVMILLRKRTLWQNLLACRNLSTFNKQHSEKK